MIRKGERYLRKKKGRNSDSWKKNDCFQTARQKSKRGKVLTWKERKTKKAQARRTIEGEKWIRASIKKKTRWIVGGGGLGFGERRGKLTNHSLTSGPIKAASAFQESTGGV